MNVGASLLPRHKSILTASVLREIDDTERRRDRGNHNGHRHFSISMQTRAKITHNHQMKIPNSASRMSSDQLRAYIRITRHQFSLS